MVVVEDIIADVDLHVDVGLDDGLQLDSADMRSSTADSKNHFDAPLVPSGCNRQRKDAHGW
jgi:hypothetical protein